MTDNIRNLALADLDKHLRHGVSLNPYSTEGGRSLWQRGYDGRPLPEPNHVGSPNWRIWQRGRFARSVSQGGVNDAE